jgi:hypothetical protein
VTPLDALRAIHEELWDSERGMDRYAPGVVPGIDIEPFNLHSVRETALGAFLDLEDGNADRAITAIDNVLALQYPDSHWPWSGTFPVTAEQHDPPGTAAVEWVHYDPNWRQFLGCILAMCVMHHGAAIPEPTVTAIDTALLRCVRGEPDGRIAPWYTNPNLMHAWLLGHVGNRADDAELCVAGERRRALIVERFDRHGDIDEYNSPTYDGIDLWALALWAIHPPTDEFRASGEVIIERMTERIGTLFHPRFGSAAGPYIRAYGLLPQRYVSLAGLCTYLSGAPADSVLPATISPDTVHVHDLYFLPVLARLAPAFVDRLDLRAITDERHHQQHFTGSLAESVLRPDLAIGWEHGRRHDASLDQYVPFSAHFDVDGEPSAVGVMVPEDTAWIDVRRAGDLEFELTAAGRADRVGVRVVVGSVAAVSSRRIVGGRCRIEFDRSADERIETMTAVGAEVQLRWSGERVTGWISVGDEAANATP